MNLILFDDTLFVDRLKPFTFTRPIATIRVGILRINQKWPGYLPCEVSFLTRPYLTEKYPIHFEGLNYYVHGAVSPNPILAEQIKSLQENDVLLANGLPIAFCTSSQITQLEELFDAMGKGNQHEFEKPFTIINHKWDIFQKNRYEILKDFSWLTHNRQSFPIDDPHTKTYGRENIFLEEGASVKAAIINAEAGPVYLGKNAKVDEGAMIRGAFALGEGSTINMGAKIRGDCSFGEGCKVGGEVGNSVIFGYSNKGHDGYLGNSVLGEWCNLGADTNNSNLKNNYSNIRVWDYATEGFDDTGLQFYGLMMGDHSKSGINTMFNTGTVVGVGAVVFGGGFMDKFIPSFTWGGVKATSKAVEPAKLNDLVERVMSRRKEGPFDSELKILEYVYQLTEKYRQ